MSEAKNTGSASDRRTLRGMLVKPREQVKYSFLFMGGSIMILTLFIGVVIYSLRRTTEALQETYGLDQGIATTIVSSLTTTLTLTFLLSAILSVFAFLIGIQLSHRIYGPLIPIQKHIESLKNGDYSSRIKLRKGDEMVEIQDSLNELADTLNTKYGSSSEEIAKAQPE